MHQVATPIWNDLATTQPLVSRWAAIMAMDPDRQLAALEEIEKKLETEGIPATVAQSYLTVMPLLEENRGISEYVQGSRNPNLRAFLPEVATVAEAVDLATREWMLDPIDQARLRSLIEKNLRPPSGASGS